MKKFPVIVLLPLLFSSCVVVDLSDDDVKFEKREIKNFSVSELSVLELRNESGDIESETWDEDYIQITFEKSAIGRDRNDAENNIKDIKINIYEDSDTKTLIIDIKTPKFTGINYRCDVFLNIPASIYLDLESSNGSITVKDSKNGLDCKTSNGPISIQDTEGDANLTTSNGKIIVKNHYGEIYGKTSNGEINVDMILPEKGKCILKTSNGNINLSIPTTTSATIEAKTSNGKIEIANLDMIIIKIGKSELRGEMGKGEGYINLETSNGKIFVKKR